MPGRVARRFRTHDAPVTHAPANEDNLYKFQPTSRYAKALPFFRRWHMKAQPAVTHGYLWGRRLVWIFGITCIFIVLSWFSGFPRYAYLRFSNGVDYCMNERISGAPDLCKSGGCSPEVASFMEEVRREQIMRCFPD